MSNGRLPSRHRAGSADPDAFIEGFPPLIGLTPRVLVLGSMPSVASLRQQQYYGHPRNAFWPIMAALFGWPDPIPSYDERCKRLQAARVAVWDVIGRCVRPGSADAAIDPSSVKINPVDRLLLATPSIQVVALNGGTARREFERHVLPQLGERAATLTCHALPSSSPAMARLSLAEKIDCWRVLLRGAGT